MILFLEVSYCLASFSVKGNLVLKVLLGYEVEYDGLEDGGWVLRFKILCRT